MLILTLLATVAMAAQGFGWVGLIVACIVGVMFVAVMLPIWTTEFGVTTQRLIYKRGLLRRTTKELQLRAVEEVNLEQGLLGRLFNHGRIELHGTGVDDVQLPQLAEPIVLQRAIQEAIGRATRNSQIVVGGSLWWISRRSSFPARRSLASRSRPLCRRLETG